MDRLTIDELEVSEKRVLTRVDFNVPLDGDKVVDATRIRAALPTIKKLTDDGGKVILMSHLGRPKGERKSEFSLKPVAPALEQLLNKKVAFAEDCVGEGVSQKVDAMQNGDVLLLENTRFHKGETENDADFAAQLAQSGDIFVNDAFGAAHRAHASTVGVTKSLKTSAAGYLLKAELEYLGKLLEAPEKPFVAILGGAKVSDKIKVIHNLITKVNAILIGGGMAYTFLKADGVEIGDSLLDDERLVMASNTLVVTRNPHPHKKLEFVLPLDHTIEGEGGHKTSAGASIPAGWRGVDIGPKTIERFTSIIANARTIFWNGPMGIFEKEAYAGGTTEVARAVAAATEKGAFSVIGGGDSVAALEKTGVKDKISHISTGGGASLEFLAGIDLPGVDALSKAPKKPAAKEKAAAND